VRGVCMVEDADLKSQQAFHRDACKISAFHCDTNAVKSCGVWAAPSGHVLVL
jgi:hypothetical protein